MVILAGASYAAIGHLAHPFALVFALCGMAAAVEASAQQGTVKILLVNGAVTASLIGAVELYLTARASYTKGTDSIPHGFFHEDKDLGYAPLPGVSRRETRFDGGRLSYAATYQIGPDALRIVPGSAPRQHAALLFGCSMMFGVGANDDQTLAAYLQHLSPGVRSINFAFPGYGPHQMLRLLQTGREARGLADATPAIGVYLSIPDHIRRAAGETSWDSHGPHFEAGSRGDAVYRGPFRETTGGRRFTERFFAAFQKSAIVAQILDARSNRPPSMRDQARFIAIVATAKDTFERRYHAPFVVVTFWPTAPEDEAIRSMLAHRGVASIPIAAFVPDIHDPDRHYQYADGHFTPRANASIARALARYFNASDRVAAGGTREHR